MSSVVDLKSKEEKDAELDKRIEALRKKNEALMRRYQEIEEDRKKAEQEGIAVTTPRKARQSEAEPDKRRKNKENLSITVDIANSAEKRVFHDGKSPNSPRDAPWPADQKSPRSPPHRTPGRAGPHPPARSPHIERPDLPLWEGSGGSEDGFYNVDQGVRGRRSRGGRGRGSEREERGGRFSEREERGGRFSEREERGGRFSEREERGGRFGEREERGGRFSERGERGCRFGEREARGGRFSERENRGGRFSERGGRFREHDERGAGDREERRGRINEREDGGGRIGERGGRFSEREERSGRIGDRGGRVTEREERGSGDREDKRGRRGGRGERGGRRERGGGGSGVKEQGSGSDEWGSGGGDSDEWGLRDGSDEWGFGKEVRGGGRVRGGGQEGRGGTERAGRAGGVASVEHRGGEGIASGVDGGVVGGPERKAKEWEEKRRQNIEKMNEEMEKIAEYERSERDGIREKNPFRNFLDDPRRCGPIVEIDRKEGSRRHTRNWGGTDFERVKTGIDRERGTHGRRPGPRSSGDMTLSMTGRERAEYIRWKNEREQIDQERLARHKKPTGQWRREWDAEKNEAMFKEGSAPIPSPDEGSRRDETKRPPKPPTFGDYFPEMEATDSGRKKDRPRERGSAKSYSMHDNRWEEKEVVVEEELEVEVPPVQEKECNVETQKEDKSAVLPASSKAQGADDDDDDEWEECTDEEMTGEEYEEEEEEEEEEEGEEEVEEVDPKREDTGQQPEAPIADSTKNERTVVPKLTIEIPAEIMPEKSAESKPSSPFSPLEGYCSVKDWGEQMDMELQSSSEDSPPQPDSRNTRPAACDSPDSYKKQMQGTVENLSHALEASGPESSDRPSSTSSHRQESRRITQDASGLMHIQVTKELECSAAAPECSAAALTEEKAVSEVKRQPVPGAVQITN